MYLHRHFFSADEIYAFNVTKSGTYAFRAWGDFGGGTLTVEEKESGLSLWSKAAATRDMTLVLERGNDLEIELNGAAAPALYFTISLLEYYDDTDRRADGSGA